jgi:hypothetical protein
VCEHDWIVVGVDDPAVRPYLLHDLMEVGLGGNARADVQELGDAAFCGEKLPDAVHEGAVGPHVGP